MKSVTELIDVMNDVEEGDRVLIATDAGEHEGVVTSTEYEYPGAEQTGSVRIEVRTEAGENESEGSGAVVVVVETAAQTNTEKFARPRVRPGDGDEESSGAVVDLERA